MELRDRLVRAAGGARTDFVFYFVSNCVNGSVVDCIGRVHVWIQLQTIY